MNVVVFGATGMVGQGALIECLDDARVERVVIVVRRTTGLRHAKLTEIVHADFLDYSVIEDRLRGLDACFFCLGIASFGLTEDEYRRITHDFALAAAKALLRASPAIVFEYVSGMSTDSSEKGRAMWARVKGKTENDLLALSDRAVMFRAGWIQPVKGVRTSTRAYRILYGVARPFYPLMKALFSRWMMTSADLGRAMIAAARTPPPKRVLEPVDINALSR